MDEVESNNSNLSFYETSVVNIFKNELDNQEQPYPATDENAEIDFFQLMIQIESPPSMTVLPGENINNS